MILHRIPTMIRIPRRRGHDPWPTSIRNGLRPRRISGVVSFLAALLALGPVAASAVTVIVPDDWPTIQQAIDSGANEILVRPGNYDETPVIATIPGNPEGWPEFDDLVIRGFVPPGTPRDSLPVIAGLVFETLAGFWTHSPSITLADLEFSKSIENRFTDAPYSNPLQIAITRCVLGQGLDDESATVGGQLEYDVRDCWVDGPVRLGYPQRAEFSGNLVRAPISLQPWPRPRWYGGIEYGVFRDNRFTGRAAGIATAVHDLELMRNRFEGCESPIRDAGSSWMGVYANTFIGPGRVAVECSYTSELYPFSGNSIVGFEKGVVGHNTEVSSFDNRIEGCGVGMEFDGYSWDGSSARDTILACGTGARLTFVNRFEMSGAVILGCHDHGLDLKLGIGVVASSIVGHCGGDGIRVAVDYAPEWSFAPITLLNNTSYANGGSGYIVSVAGTSIPSEARGNIGSGNGRYGIEMADGDSVISACNDWFGNAAGGPRGLFPSATDLCVDPLFCDVTQDDVHLSAGSPLLGIAGCGTIGARGPGCQAPAAARLVGFAANTVRSGVELRWSVTEQAPGFVAWIERAEAAAGPWQAVLPERSLEGAVTVDLDRDVHPGRVYWYRLLVTDRGWTRVLGDPTEVEIAPAPRFALGRFGANPASGPVDVEFQLAHPARIELEIFDPQGRRVGTLASGTWPRGLHRATWSGARMASAGVYLIRYRHPEGEVRRRIVILR